MPGLKTRTPSVPLSNCNLCLSVRNRERCSSTRLATSFISPRAEPPAGGGAANPLREPDDARHGTSPLAAEASAAAAALTIQCGASNTLRASGRDSSSTFGLPKADDPLRCCSATCGRAPIGREGDRGRDGDDRSVAFDDDWGFASRASRERRDPPSRSELLLFSPITSGPGRFPFPVPFPFPFPFALRGPPTTSFRSFRETALGPGAST